MRALFGLVARPAQPLPGAAASLDHDRQKGNAVLSPSGRNRCVPSSRVRRVRYKRRRNFAVSAAEPWRSSGVAHPAAEATMGFGLLEIAIVMSCISILGYIIADNFV
ncbi:MAG TPA: hypothetical protein VGO06_22540 [Bosea sp. (in: a-proteobacteria)]|jgi:hypothetical protein|uniref:hypothetical protein n=1 Tax=Bosea sp. (in: a-proteobacteria) TaxID=1871050 RepID=UPI002E104E0E|nr:hypothetical protein [Bosea sp. (in: a-proteobacteria)]